MKLDICWSGCRCVRWLGPGEIATTISFADCCESRAVWSAWAETRQLSRGYRLLLLDTASVSSQTVQQCGAPVQFLRARHSSPRDAARVVVGFAEIQSEFGRLHGSVGSGNSLRARLLSGLLPGLMRSVSAAFL